MFSRLSKLFGWKEKPGEAAPGSSGLLQVTSDATRCVQCGICGYNCPVGIEVREYARRGENVTDSRCIQCGDCIEKCPRGTLKWGPALLVRADLTLQIDPDALPTMLQLQPRLQARHEDNRQGASEQPPRRGSPPEK
jgi:ferredoxin